MQGHTKRHLPDQRSITEFKGLLFALWIAIDLVAMVLAISLSDGRFVQLGLMWVVATIFLALGTMHCGFLCIAENSRLLVFKRNAKNLLSMSRIARVPNRSHRIFAGSLLGTALLAAAPLVYSTLPVEPIVAGSLADSATPEVVTKCSEIASLEQKLFRADDKTVLADCLIQYGQMHTTARGNEMTRE